MKIRLGNIRLKNIRLKNIKLRNVRFKNMRLENIRFGNVRSRLKNIRAQKFFLKINKYKVFAAAFA